MGLTMKSINQIFKNNAELLNEPEVQEIIEYIYDLETQVINTSFTTQYSREIDLKETIRDIFNSCNSILKEDAENQRFKEHPPVDFKEAIIELKKYIAKQCHYYNIDL